MSESVMSMMAAVQCGANFILHSAGWLEGGLVMGYEKFMLDADFCGALHTWLKGVTLDENQFAMDAFHEVGPGKHFFGCAHTLANYEHAFWDSETADNNSFEQWRDAGSLSATQRAGLRVTKLLESYERPRIDASVDEALLDFVARRKSETPDQWY